MIDSNPTRIQKIANIAIVIVFVTGIWLPIIDNALNIDPNPPLYESRPLVERPQFKIEKEVINTYPDQFEKYYNDHFGFRKTLVRWNSLVNVLYLGVSTNPGVIMGQQDWLFLRGGRRGIIAILTHSPQRSWLIGNTSSRKEKPGLQIKGFIIFSS